MKYDPQSTYHVDCFDVEYRRIGETPFLARVYQPRGDGPFPAIIDVHGGHWTRGSRDGSVPFHTALAASGLLVFAIDFRLSPDNPYPAQVNDTNYGTRWLRAHAGELKGDTTRLGGIGSSSGAHTIMLSAMRPEDARYKDERVPGADDASLDFVVLRWPVIEPYVRYLYAKEAAMDHLVVGSENYFGSEEAMHEGNPTQILERGEKVSLPSILIVQGTADGNTPYTTSTRFAELYRDAGGRAEVELYEGMPHVFMNEPRPETDAATERIKTFIARELNAP